MKPKTRVACYTLNQTKVSSAKGRVDNIIQDYVSMTMRNSCEAVEMYNSSTYLQICVCNIRH